MIKLTRTEFYAKLGRFSVTLKWPISREFKLVGIRFTLHW